MIVGTVRELKNEEYRVGLTPEGAHALVDAGHRVLVESGAGAGIGCSDDAYARAGAAVVVNARDVWAAADLLVKVKEPQPEEYGSIRDRQTLFTYLHLAALPELTGALIRSRVTAIGYETVQLADGSLPLLIPMSQIAGKMATEVGAQYLRRPGPGRGKLISGIPGAPPAHVVVLGAGIVAENAIDVAVALGARVTVFDTRLEKLRRVQERWPGRTTALMSSRMAIGQALADADILIGAVLTFASTPTYDPNPFVNGIDPESYNNLRDNKDKPLLNRALNGQYAPGSTIKAFFGLGGLDAGENPGKHISCPGWYSLPGSSHRFRCWKKAGHGSVDLHTAVVQSCDVYFYRLAVSLGIERLVSINGEIVSRTSFELADMSHLSAEQAELTREALSSVKLIQNGGDNIYQATMSAQTLGGTVIQNTLNDQLIRSQTVINSTVNSTALLKTLNFNGSLSDALARAAGNR